MVWKTERENTFIKVAGNMKDFIKMDKSKDGALYMTIKTK